MWILKKNKLYFGIYETECHTIKPTCRLALLSQLESANLTSFTQPVKVAFIFLLSFNTSPETFAIFSKLIYGNLNLTHVCLLFQRHVCFA